MSQTSVRRTLFHQTLSRRPASTGPQTGPQPTASTIPGPGPGPGPNTNIGIGIAPSTTNTTNALSTRPSQHRLKPTSSETSRAIKISETREIVVRDKNGGYKLDVPALPNALIGEDGEELGELEAEGG
ncbi:uncharacterized protein N7458_006055 [Penicillium daleae]|uniref:Uncharacterized protein n=1 Tax=Penicillium daleae TaxID=63821 RepID=A0AAD6G2L3_9EURO|nr:uncharacterized protein N7458_006055 [Penicillium daleae]KAJ5449606.1 hypothetical protein N7458_006055 [Penicillium daleae]